MRKLLIAALIALAIPASANAGYVDSRTDWETLTQSEKEMYMVGAVDALGLNLEGNPDSRLAQNRGRLKCIVRLELTGTMLAKLVDEAYAGDVSKYGYPPSIMIVNQLGQVCKNDIRMEREKIGLK